MTGNSVSAVRNGEKVGLVNLPPVAFDEFRDTIVSAVDAGARLSALFGARVQKTNAQGRHAAPGLGDVRLFAVLAQEAEGTLAVTSTLVGDTYPALTPGCPQAHWFEREIAEQWGVRPEGHPWLKPIRFHRSCRDGHDAWNRSAEIPIQPGVTDFFTMTGEEVHEVAVGPVHAGIIEPGHFRFQCHGEKVYHLEISLGYQHRGVERALVGGPEQTDDSLHGDACRRHDHRPHAGVLRGD